MSASSQIDLQHFSAADAEVSGVRLSALGAGARTRQLAAERLVSFLYDGLNEPATGEPACVLVRCFQTCSYARLPLDYRDAADHLFADVGTQPEMRCLSLLATRGLKHVWNDPSTSLAHQAIPLPSVEVVRKAPMIARLLEQLHIPVEHVAAANYADLHFEGLPDNFNIFHIPEAKSSPYIPAQDGFVLPFGVRSVVGVGGLLPDGNVVAVVLFTRVPVSREAAKHFALLAPMIKNLLSPFAPDDAFARYR